MRVVGVLAVVTSIATIGWASSAVAAEASDSRPAPDPARASSFNSEQVKKVIEEHIQSRLQDGRVYHISDARTHEELDLEFEEIGVVSTEALWRVHDPERTVEGRGYFACTMFHPAAGLSDVRYDIDFWVVPRDGKLEVADVLVHREGQLVRGEWIWKTRPAAKERVEESRR